MSASAAAHAAHFARHGYFIARRFFGAGHIAALTAQIAPLFARWCADNQAGIAAGRLLNMHSLTHPRHFAGAPAARIAFFDCLLPAELTAMLDGVFGDGLSFHNTQLFFNPQGGRRPYWHRDLQYSAIDEAVQAAQLNAMLALHVRIPLVAEKGLELIPGSHRRWDTEQERAVRLQLNGRAHHEDLPGALLIDLAPGDVLVFHAQMIHRGCYRHAPLRHALDLCVGRSHRLTDGFLDAAVLPSAEEITRLNNPAWFRRARDIAETPR